MKMLLHVVFRRRVFCPGIGGAGNSWHAMQKDSGKPVVLVGRAAMLAFRTKDQPCRVAGMNDQRRRTRMRKDARVNQAAGKDRPIAPPERRNPPEKPPAAVRGPARARHPALDGEQHAGQAHEK